MFSVSKFSRSCLCCPLTCHNSSPCVCKRFAFMTQGLLPPRWRQLVRRDANGRLDPEGFVWGAPYRWGCTLVAFNEQKLSRCARSRKH